MRSNCNRYIPIEHDRVQRELSLDQDLREGILSSHGRLDGTTGAVMVLAGFKFNLIRRTLL